MTRTVALLGATGYTGRLVAAELARRGIEHRLGGRSAQRLEAVPSAGERHVVDLTDAASLNGFLDGVEVLITCVGPFAEHGMPVVEAAVRTGTPYVDSTGEVAFMAEVYRRFRGAASAVVPACGFDYIPGDLGRHRGPGARRQRRGDRRPLPPTWRKPSRGTARSAVGALTSASLTPRRIVGRARTARCRRSRCRGVSRSRCHCMCPVLGCAAGSSPPTGSPAPPRSPRRLHTSRAPGPRGESVAPPAGDRMGGGPRRRGARQGRGARCRRGTSRRAVGAGRGALPRCLRLDGAAACRSEPADRGQGRTGDRRSLVAQGFSRCRLGHGPQRRAVLGDLVTAMPAGAALPGAAGLAAGLGRRRTGPLPLRLQPERHLRAARVGPRDRRTSTGDLAAERHDRGSAVTGRRAHLVVRRQRRRRVRCVDAAAVRRRTGREGGPRRPARVLGGSRDRDRPGGDRGLDRRRLHPLRRRPGLHVRPLLVHRGRVGGRTVRDGRLVLVEHSEHGDSRHPALRVIDVDGRVIADLWDGPGLGLHGVGFAPGGTTVLAVHEQAGRPMPLLWEPVSGDVTGSTSRSRATSAPTGTPTGARFSSSLKPAADRHFTASDSTEPRRSSRRRRAQLPTRRHGRATRSSTPGRRPPSPPRSGPLQVASCSRTGAGRALIGPGQRRVRRRPRRSHPLPRRGAGR